MLLDHHGRNAHLNRIRKPVFGESGLNLPGGNAGDSNNGAPAPAPGAPTGSQSSTQSSSSSSPPANPNGPGNAGGQPNGNSQTSTGTSSSSSSTSSSSAPPPLQPSSSQSSSASSSASSSSSATVSPASSATPPPDNTETIPSSQYTPPPSTITYTSSYDPGLDGASASSSPTTLPDTTSSGSVGKYIGLAAIGVLGFVGVVAAVMFVMRRINKRREDEALGDVFDNHSFVRDSVAIPDAPTNDPMSERGRPRPPTMIDRHIRNANNTSPYGDFGPGYGAPPVTGNSGGYYGQGTNAPYDEYGNLGYNGSYDGHYDQYAQFGGPQTGYASFEDTTGQVPAEHYDYAASGPEYPVHPAPAASGSPPPETGRSLTRQPSSKIPGVQYPNVAELGRGTSVTPFQAAQYAEISKRLDDPASPPSDSDHAYAQLARHPTSAGRPQSEYHADDAYAGI